MNNSKIDLSNFDFDEFKTSALGQLKAGQPLTGKGGILTPLIKQLLESALEGEIESHLQAICAQAIGEILENS